MKIIIEKDYDQMSKAAANIIATIMNLNERPLLGLATGSTPIGTYQNLVTMNKEGKITFKDTTTVNLDEYKGIKPTDKNSYRYFMNQNLFDHVDIDKTKTHVPDGTAKDGKAECKRYNDLLKDKGRVDIQILGIGENGHIGFNEPSDTFIRDTHTVKLAQSTIDANKRFFDTIDDVPKEAYTMGIGNIMNAKTVLIMASGGKKAKAMKDSIQGPITPQVPASILQLHPQVIFIGDQQAMKDLD